MKDPQGRVARWALFLLAFEFEIIHRKGKSHTNVDALSRPILVAQIKNKSNNDEEHTTETNEQEEDSIEKSLDP